MDIRVKHENLKSITDYLDELFDELVIPRVKDLEAITNTVIGKDFDTMHLDILGDTYVQLAGQVCKVSASIDKIGTKRIAAEAVKSETWSKTAMAIRTASILAGEKKTQTDINAEADNAACEDEMLNDLIKHVVDSIQRRINSANTLISALKHRYTAKEAEANSERIANAMRNSAQNKVGGNHTPNAYQRGF